MNNIRVKLNEETQTVNEVQLKDLYLAATKGLQTLLNINTMAINFSNPGIKRKAQSLNSLAFELVTEIQKVMDNSGEVAPTSAMLDQDKAQEKVLEMQETNDGATMSINENVSKIQAIMYSLKLTENDAKMLAESYKFESEEKEEDKESIEEALNEEDGLFDGDMDLSEAYSMTEEGQLDESKFEAFHEKLKEAVSKYSDLHESINKMDSKRINEMIDAIYDYADKNSIIVKN